MRKPKVPHNLTAFGTLFSLMGATALIQLVMIISMLPSLTRALLSLTFLAYQAWHGWLAFHAWRNTPTWHNYAAANLLVAHGLGCPLIFWGVSLTVTMNRGHPFAEAIIVSGHFLKLDVLPFRGMLVQHTMYITIAIANSYFCSPLQGIWTREGLTWFLPVALGNYACGLMGTSLMCLARNRHHPSNVLSFRALLALEARLLKGVSQDAAEAALASLCAMYVVAFFLFTCSNFTLLDFPPPYPSTVLLALMLAMFWGSSDTMHARNLAAAQARAYCTVRTLLHGMVPRHIAKRMERVESRRRLADGCPEDKRADGQHSFVRVSGSRGLARSQAAWGRCHGASVPGMRRVFTKCADFWQGRLRAQLSSLLRKPPHVHAFTRRTLRRSAAGGGSAATPVVASRAAEALAGGVRRRWFVEAEGARTTSASLALMSMSSGGSMFDEPMAVNRDLDFDAPVLQHYTSCSERHDSVTVLFSDLSDFTALSEQLAPSQVMLLLGELYSKLDKVAKELKVFTVDTIGDCYFCAANLIEPLPNHADVMVLLAKRILQITTSTTTPLGTPLGARVGISTGPLMSGVLGEHRMKFTLVGDTVNLASRMQSSALRNTLQVSQETFELLQNKPISIHSPDGSVAGGSSKVSSSRRASKVRFSTESLCSKGESGISCSTKESSNMATPALGQQQQEQEQEEEEEEEQQGRPSESSTALLPNGNYVDFCNEEAGADAGTNDDGSACGLSSAVDGLQDRMQSGWEHDCWVSRDIVIKGKGRMHVHYLAV